jgi:two-component system sensor histidine kinase KdpD
MDSMGLTSSIRWQAGWRITGLLTRLRMEMADSGGYLSCLLALTGVSVCTWISFRLGLNLGAVGFLYLVFVVLTAVYGGFRQATLISVIAVAYLDYFFDEPIYSFSVGRLSNWVALAAFEFTALVISRLSNRARLRELEAIGKRHEAEQLYQMARRMLLLNSHGDSGQVFATLIRDLYHLRAVVLFDACSASFYESGNPPEGTSLRTRDAYVQNWDKFEPGERSWFCVLRLGVQPVGALALCGTDISELAATALASLGAIALERSRSLEKQYQAEAARRAEQSRTAVLDALAHQFKTPLTIIRTANSGLTVAGDLSEMQTELVTLVDQEARKLNDLASRLVGAPALESTEFEPQPEPLLLSRLMKAAIQELERPEDRDRFQVAVPAHESAVFADRELILTALAQLIDNALKYSLPKSPIDVGLRVKEATVVLTIRSKGLVVAAADRERIFERFYRTPGAQSFTGGTGLGLSIVKTIASDHRGSVWAEGEAGYGTVFGLSLPIGEEAEVGAVPGVQ